MPRGAIPLRASNTARAVNQGRHGSYLILLSEEGCGILLLKVLHLKLCCIHVCDRQHQLRHQQDLQAWGSLQART